MGGLHDRYLPKELYLPETGGAETAVGIFKATDQPGRVTLQDRTDLHAPFTWDYRLKVFVRRAAARLVSRRAVARSS